MRGIGEGEAERRRRPLCVYACVCVCVIYQHKPFYVHEVGERGLRGSEIRYNSIKKPIE